MYKVHGRLRLRDEISKKIELFSNISVCSLYFEFVSHQARLVQCRLSPVIAGNGHCNDVQQRRKQYIEINNQIKGSQLAVRLEDVCVCVCVGKNLSL